MKKPLILFLFCWAMSNMLSAQVPPFHWANDLKKSSITAVVTTDKHGNVYATGQFFDTVDFDPGPGTFNLTTSHTGSAYVVKYDPAGDLIWAVKTDHGASVPSKPHEFGKAICVDNQGSVYTMGTFNNMTDFEPGTGVHALEGYLEGSTYVWKLDSAGRFVWVRQFGRHWSGTDMTVWSVNTDSWNNVYVGGTLDRERVDFRTGPDSLLVSPNGYSDAFVCKYTTAGDFLWVKQIGATLMSCTGNSTRVDSLGNIYMTGTFGPPTAAMTPEAVDFNPGPGAYNITPTPGGNDVFVVKLDSAANLIWVRHIGTTPSERGQHVGIDGQGNVFVSGNFSGTLDFDPSPSTTYTMTSTVPSFNNFNGFILKLNAAGNFVWAKKTAEAGFGEPTAMAVDRAGNVYRVGMFTGNYDFDSGNNVWYMAAAGNTDIYINKFDVSGNFAWGLNIGGTNGDGSKSVAVDPYGNIISSFMLNDTVDVDHGPGTLLFTSSEAPFFQSCIHKMGPCKTPKIPANINSFSDLHVCPNSSTILYANGLGTVSWYSASGQYLGSGGAFGTPNLTESTLYYVQDSICRSSGRRPVYVEVYPEAVYVRDLSICSGESVTVGTHTYTSTGMYTDIFSSAVTGCDSTVITNILVHDPVTASQTQTICAGGLLMVGPFVHTAAGTYTDTITSVLTGCDSIVTTALSVTPSVASSQAFTICSGETVVVGPYIHASTGVYTDTLTSSLTGCDSIVSTDLQVKDPVDVSITLSGISIIANAGGASYMWIDCSTGNPLVPQESNQLFTAAANGSYAVIVTENGCADTSSCVLVSAVGISELLSGQIVKLYPNPFQQSFSIDLPFEANVMVVNMLGAMLANQAMQRGTGTIDLSGHAAGVYFVKVVSGAGSTVIRMLKQE